MNPIWDREEQARIYLRLLENTAMAAPSTMVTAPSASSRTPHRCSPGRRSAVMIRAPKMPALVRTPDSRALAGAGATGWALGSQMCSGNTPALAAKPNRMHRAAAHSCPRSVTMAQASGSWAMTRVPVSRYSRNRPIRVTRPPSTAMAR